MPVSPLWPRPRPEIRPVDPVAFGIAMIGGPLLITLATFWLFLIPVGALILGGPLYLAIGTPVLLIWLMRHKAHADEVSILALLAHAILAGGFWAILKMADERSAGIAGFYFICGLIFAPVWGMATGWLYTKLEKP